MDPKEAILAKVTVVWALLFVVIGSYGLATGRYYLPSRSSGLIEGADAYPLSGLTLLLGAMVALPSVLSLCGVTLGTGKKVFLVIQYGLVAGLIYFVFRRFF